jgi:putative ABC transport system ATP-binding protein
MSIPIIEMVNLNKSYGSGDTKVHVLKDVSLKIESRELLSMLGPAGSGKTTLMNIIGLIDTHDSGDYLLDGENIEDLTENEYSDIRNHMIGFVFQKFNLIAKYTALYNVALPLLLRGESRGEAIEKAYDTLKKVGLADRVKHKPIELSGGQQQRVAIARAIIGDSNIILADEPTGALDSKTGQEVIGLLQKMNSEGKTVIIITHDKNVASQTNKIVNVMDGKITYDF